VLNEVGARYARRHQPIHEALVRLGRQSDEPVLAALDALDLELLPRLDRVDLANLGRQHDLALGGNDGFHAT
jgi:hypothetical protein